MYIPESIAPIIKVVENCNYNCGFCRYANHPPTGDSIMSLELCKKLLYEVCAYNYEHGRKYAQFIFHGGEPLLWGKHRYEEILKYEEELKKMFPELVIENGMQSNGYLIDDEWIELFKKMDMHVGISLDGPAEMNFHYGTDGNEPSIQRVIGNIHKLQENKLTNGILSVITDKHLGHEQEYFDFLNKHNLPSSGFCYCYNPRDEISIDPLDLAGFLCKSFDIYYHAKKSVRIREFDNILLKLYGRPGRNCVFGERVRCGNFPAFSPNGNVGFCDEYEADTAIIGDYTKQSLKEILESDVYQEARVLYTTATTGACVDCEWRCVCGCGCARNDIGEGAERKSYFCETYKKLYAHIAETVKNDSRLEEENKNIVK